MAGSIKGNIYTSSSIPTTYYLFLINITLNFEKNVFFFIVQQLRVFDKDEFFLKYPNDILCKDKKNLGSIISQNYKDFCIIGFGLNIIDKPEQTYKKRRITTMLSKCPFIRQ